MIKILMSHFQTEWVKRYKTMFLPQSRRITPGILADVEDTTLQEKIKSTHVSQKSFVCGI